MAIQNLLWWAASRILFLLDPEVAHHVTVRIVRTIGHAAPFLLRWLSGGPWRRTHGGQPTLALGMTFMNPVGLAAGFDKNAELLPFLPDLGFGFVEIGTVTPRAQPGNDRPRLARDLKAQKIFNRMGFNNLGAEMIASRVREARPKLPKDFRIGINLGKNKETSTEDTPADYEKAARTFIDVADFFVINVSSPNTPGLRSLQSLESLLPICRSVMKVAGTIPVLVKFSPEFFQNDDLPDLSILKEVGIRGIVATNTLAGSYDFGAGSLPGGWSGSGLDGLSEKALMTGQKWNFERDWISVGGIMDAATVKKRLEMGAGLVEIYSGWVFRGPVLMKQVRRLLGGIGLAIIGLTSGAQAAQNLKVVNETSIFAEASGGSAVLGTLQAGDDVRASDSPKDGYYKVVLPKPTGGRKFGWVSTDDLATASGAMKVEQKKADRSRKDRKFTIQAFGGMPFYQPTDIQYFTDDQQTIRPGWMVSGDIGYHLTKEWTLVGAFGYQTFSNNFSVLNVAHAYKMKAYWAELRASFAFIRTQTIQLAIDSGVGAAFGVTVMTLGSPWLPQESVSPSSFTWLATAKGVLRWYFIPQMGVVFRGGFQYLPVIDTFVQKEPIKVALVAPTVELGFLIDL